MEWEGEGKGQGLYDGMPVLAVRQPFAAAIIDGFKTIDVRTRATNTLGRVAIYASHTKADQDFEDLKDILSKLESDFMTTGYIIGTVEIYDSPKEPFKYENSFGVLKPLHLLENRWFEKNRTFLWYLRNPIRFEIPIPYSPKKGCVTWSIYEE